MSSQRVLPHSPALVDLAVEDLEALCAHDRLVDAVIAALWRLHGLRGFSTNLYGERRKDAAVMVVPLADDTYGYWYGRSSEARNWARELLPTSETLHEQRRWLLQQSLHGFETGRATITTTLRQITPEPPINQALLTVLIAAWWAERVSEGHTDDSARMLLGLTVSTPVLRWLRFNDEGPPEVLGWRAAEPSGALSP